MRLWRIAGASYDVWSGEGARLYGARWNPPGLPAIYAGTSYAICALEILVHANANAPPRHLRYVEAVLPDESLVERADVTHIDGWAGPNIASSQAFGRAWLLARKKLVLLVPSVVTQGLDWNALVNPLHPDFASISVSNDLAVAWDSRLRSGK